MKKFLHASIYLLLALSLQAQTFSSPSDSIFKEGPADDYFHEVTTTINTEQSDDLILKWKLISENMPTKWVFNICDNKNCYDDVQINNEFESLPINNSSYGFYKIGFQPNFEEGCGVVKIYTFEKDNEANHDTYTFAFCSMPTSINAVRLKNNSFDFAMFPNPANHNMTLTFAEKPSKGISVKVINLLGQEQVIEFSQVKNNLLIDLSQIRNGNYLLQVVSNEGMVVTKRFTKR